VERIVQGELLRLASGVRINVQQLPAVVIHAAVFRRLDAAAAWMA
jgi:hypothetical protein